MLFAIQPAFALPETLKSKHLKVRAFFADYQHEINTLNQRF